MNRFKAAVLLLSVSLSIGLFSSYLYFVKREKKASFDVRGPVMFDGEKIFHEGAYSRVKNRSSEESCHFENKMANDICLEGFYYIEYIEKFNSLVQESKLSQSDLHFELISFERSLALGMAMSYLGLKLNEIKFTGESFLIKYVADGWGLHEFYVSVKRGRSDEQVCPQDHYVEHCLFGSGRAAFYLGFSVNQALGGSMRQGYMFAQKISNSLGSAKSPPSEKQMAKSIDIETEEEFYRCIYLKKTHFLECFTTS